MGSLPHALDVLSSMTFDALLLVDDERRFLRMNERGASVLGAPPDDVLGRTIDDFTSTQFEPLLPELWSSLDRNGRLSGVYEARRGDGSIAMLEFSAKRDMVEGQHLILARDLAHAVSARSGFALVDPRTAAIDEASAECCRLVGRSRGALLEAGLDVFGGTRGRDAMVRAVRAVADGSHAGRVSHCKIRRPGGGVQRLAISLRPLRGALGRPVRILLEAVPVVATPDGDILSAREREVLQLAADGGTAATIAKSLKLSPGTVRTHLRTIYAKLGTRDRSAAVADGLRRGLVE